MENWNKNLALLVNHSASIVVGMRSGALRVNKRLRESPTDSDDFVFKSVEKFLTLDVIHSIELAIEPKKMRKKMKWRSKKPRRGGTQG
jgi:hypothetical protein